ncbi:MAG: PLP-dependent aspartate aminotransferase family protein [Oscillospiraceae bacterium]|jgi:cystathionine beta-lyase/cystathionine gamma-synthase|nr:PLP-dependent aspartate aminotransferase family protein [Oscillospiraceae bacterium]
MNPETACIHASRDTTHSTGAVCAPIYQSATFAHLGVGRSTGYDYSRLQNPTREQVERTLAALEGGADAMAFATGMAATACLMELFNPGDHLIASDDLYGGTVRLFDRVSAKNGVCVDYLDTNDLQALAARITPSTRAVFVETPTNPMMHVTDIAAVKALLTGRDILLIVDNTFLTPYFCRPISLGADVVLHSGTKYLGGHNDTLAGFLVAAQAGLAEKLRFLYKTTGAVLSPFDSYLVLRGIKTLAIRMRQSQANAQAIAQWMLGQKKIRRVHYVGLPDHPGIAVSRRQATGFGGMISFETDAPETALRVLERVKLILFAESLGGVETLITYPAMQTHADVPAERRETQGITDRLLRLSVGIEAAEDLIADLAQALED